MQLHSFTLHFHDYIMRGSLLLNKNFKALFNHYLFLFNYFIKIIFFYLFLNNFTMTGKFSLSDSLPEKM